MTQEAWFWLIIGVVVLAAIGVALFTRSSDWRPPEGWELDDDDPWDM